MLNALLMRLCKLISFKSLIFRFRYENLMLSIKLCHAEVNQTYHTCAFIQFIFGVTFFQPLVTNLGLDGKLKKTHMSMKDACIYSIFQFSIDKKIVITGQKNVTLQINLIKAHVGYVRFTSAWQHLLMTSNFPCQTRILII